MISESGQYALSVVELCNDYITLSDRQMSHLLIISEMRYADGADVMQGINANDVAGIEILKGASASFFGMEASDGVIVVSLKMGADVKKEAYICGGVTGLLREATRFEWK